MTGSRLLFWLHAFTRALSDRGYWSGVVICFSMRQPMTRASSADSSMFIERSVHHTRTRSAGPRYSFWPGLTPNASYHASSRRAVSARYSDGAGGAVIHDGLPLRVEVRRLQHRGRKVERIHRRKIHGVHRLRRHAPLGAIDRGAELGEIVVQLEQLGALRIAERVAADHFQPRIIPPLVRIADPDLQGSELGFCPGARLGCHPLEPVDAHREGSQQIAHHRLGARFLARRKVALYVQLAHRLAQRRVGLIDRALPSGAQLRRAREHPAVELEVLLDKGFGQIRGVALDFVKAQVIPPGLKRLTRGERGQSGESARLPYHELFLPRETRSADKSFPVESR